MLKNGAGFCNYRQQLDLFYCSCVLLTNCFNVNYNKTHNYEKRGYDLVIG